MHYSLEYKVIKYEILALIILSLVVFTCDSNGITFLNNNSYNTKFFNVLYYVYLLLRVIVMTLHS